VREAFPRIDGELVCGGIPLRELAERYGTPLFVYDLDHVEERFRAVGEAFGDVAPLIAYSVKANGNLALMAHLGRLGAGADIVSEGELHRARLAGVPAGRIVFSGVAKTASEMRRALEEGILAFNVESRGELERLDRVARDTGAIAPFAVRVNPEVVPPTPHEYTRTGHADSKFGVVAHEAVDLYRWAAAREHLRPVGIDVHIGSQILEAEPYLRAMSRVMGIVERLRADGLELDFVDMGGGFGVPYGSGEPSRILEEVAAALAPRVLEAGLRLIVEPGRYIVGEAGLLLTRVEYVKRTPVKTFVIVDGGMTELIRPSHYGGWHDIQPVVSRPDAREAVVDVVGPICETGDFLARDRAMILPEPEDLLAVRTVGAYGFSMASNYNARRRPAEAVVLGGSAYLARSRETLEDLVRGETVLDLLDPPSGE
jgi:diaminopimelate decarboxylase